MHPNRIALPAVLHLLAIVLASFDDSWNHAVINIGGGILYVAVTLLIVRPFLERIKDRLLHQGSLSEAGLVVGIDPLAIERARLAAQEPHEVEDLAVAAGEELACGRRTPGAITAEATLSFFGWGPDAGSGMTSLGLLIRDSKKAVPPGYWWLVVYPGAFFILLSLCINFIGDGLRDAVDPKMQQEVK